MKWFHKLLRTVLPVQMMRKLVMSRFVRVGRRVSGLAAWVVTGRFSGTNDLMKVWTISNCAQIYQTRVFVETGTYLGDMIHAQEHNFERLFSVELDSDLYQHAVDRFRSNPKIVIFQGDSAMQISKIIKMIDEPALFWLDAHFSQGITAKGTVVTPILNELEQILRRPFKDVILIDDAESFDGTNGYPTTAQLEKFVANFEDRRIFALAVGIFCVTCH